MSEQSRTPGRIEEEATPVDGSAGLSANAYLGAEDKNREPGPVEGPSEAMPDDQVNAQSGEIANPEFVERSPWSFVFWLLSAGVFIWLLMGVVSAIAGAWHQSIWLGLPLAALASIFLAVLIWASLREYKAWKTIDALADRRTRIHTALASDDLYALRETLAPTLNNLRLAHSIQIATFEEAAKSRETASEYLKQFENIVLIQLDKEANAVIKRSALVGGTVIAIVPHPALDAIVALWRATVLIRTIGEVYGLKPTGLSSLRLLKHSIATAIIAAGSDIAVDLTIDQVGQDVVDQVSSNIGKGVAGGTVTAWRLYRLGKYAQRLCRPMTD